MYLTSALTNVHLSLEKDFESLIRGKSVAILGRGPSLSGGSAEVIESCDTIARVHRPAPVDTWWPPPLVQTEWQSKVGTRTDILYTSFGLNLQQELEVQLDFMNRVISSFAEEGGKMLCRPEPFYALFELTQSSHLIEEKHPLRYLGIGVYEELKKTLKSVPYPGTCVVADIMMYEPARVFIGGMTCYLDASPVGIIEMDHVSKSDFNFIRNIWRSNADGVRVDPLMEELFQTIDESIPTRAPTAAEIYQTSADGSVNTYVQKQYDD